MVRDVGLAEELAQDALVAALERWPESGVPDNPGAWLMATAKRRAIDELRRRRLLEQKREAIGHAIDTAHESPEDIVPWETARAVDDAAYSVGPRSVAVLWRQLERT